jgi:pyridoxamine 5'-phosphate oxidase
MKAGPASRRIARLRREYGKSGLREKSAHRDPIQQFSRWFEEAVRAGLHEPNAMSLATTTRRGHPSTRVVLLKDFGHAGFAFFTNYGSRKGREIDNNPRAALAFYWHEFERQVRIEGKVKRVSRAVSAVYFASRPRDAQLGAWASNQSGLITSRAELESKFKRIEKQYAGKPVPVPPFWGGYIVVPDAIEFWQGRANRLHDRLLYKRRGKKWSLSRLSP